MAGTRLTGTTARACPSSIAMPPQWAPPMLPGCERVPCVLGGVNGPSLRSAARMSWQAALASGVGPQASSAEYRSGTRGGVTAVKGCVRDATSPGTVLGGTGRSSTGKIGVPVVRSSTYSIPDFPVWMTAGILAPFRVTVTSAGGAAFFTQPHPAEVIRCGTRRWKEHEIARGIGDDHRPDVGSADDPGGSVLPGLEHRIG